MLTKKRYSLWQVARWTRLETYLFIIIAVVPAFLISQLQQTWIQLPWTPVAVIGTAVAFVIGFQNNAAYGRIWEARKIWGGIVNTSRSWGVLSKDMVTSEHTKEPIDESEIKNHIKTLVYRHIAWLTALRYEMREGRAWEFNKEHKTTKEWENQLYVPERRFTFEESLKGYLSANEIDDILKKNNKPTAILSLQSQHLKTLKSKGLLWEFSFLKLEGLIVEMFNLQGKSERIKNFPYPRQYATIAHYFVWTFILLLPFAIIPEFYEIGKGLESDYPSAACYFIWLSVPFIVAISWVFHTMERIGRVGENPFEGTANDVPISTISRGIEIDLRQMLGEDESSIPKQFPAELDVQM